MGYAKHVGRLGVLAIALGVGYGLADATASASTGDSSGSDSSSSASQRPARQAGPARAERRAAASAKRSSSTLAAAAVKSASTPKPSAARRDRAPRSTAAAPKANAGSLSPNLLTNPGAEFGNPSQSGFSAVSIPGWAPTGTPTVIQYGTPRNLWPMGLDNPTPNLPKFFSFPQPSTNASGGTKFFGGGNVASATLTQTVDLSGAGGLIDAGNVNYDLAGQFGGFLIDPSRASLKVTFLDQNQGYLGTNSTKSVGVLNRFFMTGFKERDVSGVLPEGTRYAQVELMLDDHNPRWLGFRARYNNAYADNLSFQVSAPLSAPGDPTPTPTTPEAVQLDHVFMVYMENKGYDDILGSPNAPYLNSLIEAYGFLDNFYGSTHPSLPNYYPILGGSDFGKTYNCADVCIDAPNTLMENLDDAGLVWRSYAQGFVAGMNPLESSGEYAVDETAFPAFTYFANNPDPNYATDHLLPLEQMAIDLQSTATTPNYVWFAADENSNGEGPIDSIGGLLKFAFSQISPGHQYNVPALDEYLAETVPTILESNAWNSSDTSVLVITFDEDNNNTSLGFGNEGNHIVTVVIPNQAAIDAGMRSGPYVATDHYNHYSLLRFIDESLGLPYLTLNDQYASPMNEIWGSTLPSA